MIQRSDFDWVRKLVRDRAAIVLDERKTYLVAARLTPLAKDAGFEDIGQMLLAIRSGRRRDLADAIVDAMTINETSFFRDGSPWEALQSNILPEIIERRARRRRLRMWSAACSTGQEPYTMAMLLRMHFPHVCDWDVEILATDISSKVLRRAEQGIYQGTELSRGLDPELRDRFFEKDEHGRYHLDDEIRRMATFRKVNLARPWPGWIGQFDIIFVRNVLIYFDADTKKDILGRMEQHLLPDGYLLLGSGETTFNMGLGLRRQHAARAWFYQHG